MDIEVGGNDITIYILRRNTRGSRFEAWVEVLDGSNVIMGNHIISTPTLLSDDDVFDRAADAYLEHLAHEQEGEEEEE